MTSQNLAPKPTFDDTAEVIHFNLASPMDYTVQKFAVVVTDDGLGPPDGAQASPPDAPERAKE